jgi:hypothetical protein
MKHLQSAPFCFVLLFGFSAGLTGCSMGSFQPSTPSTDIPTEMSGAIHGGQQPIVGSTVTMYETNTNGAPGTVTDGSVVVGQALALTDANGAFNFATTLTCNPGGQLWIEAAGGDPIDGPKGTTNHPAVLQAAALGPCPTLGINIGGTYTYVFIDEVSTVAFAYVAGPWYTGSALNSAWPQTPAGQLGVAQAFATAGNLYAISGGSGQGLANTTTPNGNGTVPQATIHTIANIDAACINSAVGSATCSTYFGATGGSTATTNTLQALVYMARHIGGVPVATVYPLQPTTPQFSPNLSTAPTSFALEVLYTGGGIKGPDGPGGIAIDANNNIWIASQSQSTAGIGEFSNLGVVKSPLPNGWTDSSLSVGTTFITLGGNGSLDAITQGNSCLTSLNNNGSIISGAPCNTAMTDTEGIAAGSSHLWIADTNLNEISEVTTSAYTATLSGNGLNHPYAVAVDDSQNVWVANFLGNTYSKFTSAGVAVSTGGSGLNQPGSVALDKSSNAWFANRNDTNIVELNSAGTAVAGSPFTCGAGNASGIAVDGDGNVFTMGFTTISEYTAAGICEFQSVPAVGGGGTRGIVAVLSGLAIDGSGNIWFSSSTGNQVGEIIGMAAPVVTPLALAANNGTLGTRP